MGVTKFPGGLESPSIGSGWTAVPGKVFYVCNRSDVGNGNGQDPDHPFSTLNAALQVTVSGRGDAVRILPGHVESIATADQMSNLKASTLIEGWGWGAQRGILRWTAAGATFLLDVAGVAIRNLRMQMAGDPAATTALTVAAAMTVTGVGCRMEECDIDVGVDADQLITAGIIVNAAGFEMYRNRIHGAPLAVIGDTGTVIRLIAADRFVFRNNYLAAGLLTATDGLIETLTTASKDIDIQGNYFHANGSGDTCALDFGVALACSGILKDNVMNVVVDGTAETVVFTRSATNDLALQDNFLVNNNNERGLVIGTASA